MFSTICYIYGSIEREYSNVSKLKRIGIISVVAETIGEQKNRWSGGTLYN